jgi:hypothetical protein
MIGSDACVLLRWTLPPKRSARLAQKAESASSRLIKMLIAFSERPPRGGLSVCCTA